MVLTKLCSQSGRTGSMKAKLERIAADYPGPQTNDLRSGVQVLVPPSYGGLYGAVPTTPLSYRVRIPRNL